MKWTPFNYKGQAHDLEHLHPFEWTYMLPAKGGKPAQCYHFDVMFGLHTFTKGIETADPALHYRDSREAREFDFDRYELSKGLPEIVQSLGERKCHHTHHGNFFTVDLFGEDEVERRYEIYFVVSRSGKKRGRLNLMIQSAYERTEGHGDRPKRKPPIRFHVIAHNTLHKKQIKAPK